MAIIADTKTETAVSAVTANKVSLLPDNRYSTAPFFSVFRRSSESCKQPIVLCVC